MNISSISCSNNQMCRFPNFALTAKILPRDTSLDRTLLPPSEKDDYTKEDALMNQYMKQFRIDGKVVGNTFILKEDSQICLVSSEDITSNELEGFKQQLIQDGVSNTIDWRGLENDFDQMKVRFDNAENLNTKIDYISSRYAVLKNRIDKDYSGDEKNNQLNKLNETLTNAKKTIVDSYSNSIGGFYEDLGNNGVSEKMRESLSVGIDNRIKEYQTYLSDLKNQSNISKDTEEWLLKDDAYMAAQLRKHMSAGQSEEEVVLETSKSVSVNAEYTLRDLGVAGVFAKESAKQYDSNACGADECAIGLDLAVQAMKVDYLTKNGKVSNKMTLLMKSSFNNYADKYIDMLDKAFNKASRAALIPLKEATLDRKAIYNVYNYTVSQYENSNDIMDAISKGAKKAQSLFNADFAKNGGSYSSKYEWDSFFQIKPHDYLQADVTGYSKYLSTVNYFKNSFSSENEKNIQLMFGMGGRISTDRYSESILNLHA